MPEILEVEMFREAAAKVIGRTVREAMVDDGLVVSEPDAVASIVGRRIVDVTRHGKVMTIHAGGVHDRMCVDVHFGMAGRIIVDGWSPIGELAYGASDDSRWIRFGLVFGRGEMLLSDPRRFARVGPSNSGAGLGPDALLVSRAEFVGRLRGRRAPVKAVLLDQSVVAGLGNMLVDEILLRAGIDPRRSVVRIDDSELGRVFATMRRVLPELAAKGGSHAGRLSAEMRIPGSRCPMDASVLERVVVGGRTTYLCPGHQR